jgi:putative transposase
MQYYRTTAHTKYDHKYHLVWITKYRKKVLTGEIGLRTREIIKQICEGLEVDIVRGNISPDHIHLFVSIPPKYSVSEIMKNLKGITSRRLQQAFPELQREYWGRHFWAIGYFSATSGTITDEMIMEYIEEQGKNSEDEDFKITN